MVLTPIDVQQKTFATALRGYDLDEVDDFLDSVVLALKDYDQRLRDAQERIAALESELDDQGDAEGAIARALVVAQRSADSIVADAKEEAERIVAEAHSEAGELVEQRDTERVRLENEISVIRSKIENVRSGVAELAALLPSQLDEMESVLDAAEPAPVAVGATFDAAEPTDADEEASRAAGASGGAWEAESRSRWDSSDSDEDAVVPSTAAGAEDAVDEDDQQDDEPTREPANEDDEAVDEEVDDESADPERDGAREIPDLQAITDRIDAAFGDDVPDLSEGATRPWET